MTVTPRGHGIFGPGPLSLGQFSCRPGRMVAGAPCPHSTTKRRSLRADRYPRGRSWPVTTARRLLPSRLATLLVPSPLLAQQRWLATNPCARLPPPEHRAHLPSGPPRRHPLDRRQPRHAHDCLQAIPGARRSQHPGLLSCSLAGSTDAEGGEPPGHCGSALARRVPLRGGAPDPCPRDRPGQAGAPAGEHHTERPGAATPAILATGRLPGDRRCRWAPMPRGQARWDGRPRRPLDQVAAEGGTIQPARSAAGVDRA